MPRFALQAFPRGQLCLNDARAVNGWAGKSLPRGSASEQGRLRLTILSGIGTASGRPSSRGSTADDPNALWKCGPHRIGDQGRGSHLDAWQGWSGDCSIELARPVLWRTCRQVWQGRHEFALRGLLQDLKRVRMLSSRQA